LDVHQLSGKLILDFHTYLNYLSAKVRKKVKR